MRYRAIYKCAMCGRLLTVGEPTEVPEERLPDMLATVIKSQKFQVNPYLSVPPLQIPHKCQDGSAGIAWFAGFQRV